jgi:hypothetical protein
MPLRKLGGFGIADLGERVGGDGHCTELEFVAWAFTHIERD